MKPKAPKKRDPKPSAKSGEVREQDNQFYNTSLMEVLGDCTVDYSDMKISDFHKGLPVYTPIERKVKCTLFYKKRK